MNRRGGWLFTFLLIVFFAIVFLVSPSSDKKKDSSFHFSRSSMVSASTKRPSTVPFATQVIDSKSASPSLTSKPAATAKQSSSKRPHPSSTPIPTAHNGDRGDIVELVQTRLSGLGYAVGQIDGIYGNKTMNAVKAFQEDNGLEATGEIDKRTFVEIATLYKTQQAVNRKNNTIRATPRPTATPAPTKANRKVENTDYRDSASKSAKYVLNTSSKKFHKPRCQYVTKIKPKNYKEYTGTREDVISMGYVPCKKCSP